MFRRYQLKRERGSVGFQQEAAGTGGFEGESVGRYSHGHGGVKVEAPLDLMFSEALHPVMDGNFINADPHFTRVRNPGQHRSAEAPRAVREARRSQSFITSGEQEKFAG